jgi:HSP20 family protein
MDTRVAKTAVSKRRHTKSAVPQPTEHPSSPLADMDLFFDRLSHGLLSRLGFPALAGSGWPHMEQAPKIDLLDRGKELVLKAAIPGVTKEDLEVSLHEGVVTIRGQTRSETSDDTGDYHRREISSGSFERAVALPADVLADKARASFRDGVLEVVMPKTDKPSGRTIAIS